MKLLGSSALVATFALSAASESAFAQYTLQLNQSLFSASAQSSRASGGGTTTWHYDAKTIPTAPEIVVGFDSLFLHFYPTTAASSVSLGYQASPELELGVSVGTDWARLRPGSDGSSKMPIGIFGFYGLDMGGSMLELTGNVGMTFASNSATAAGVVTKTESQEVSAGILAAVACPLAKGFSWVGSLGYTYTSDKDKKANTTTSANRFEVIPLGLRFDFASGT